MFFRIFSYLLFASAIGMAFANSDLDRGDYWYQNRAAGAKDDKADRKIADNMTDAYRRALADSNVEEIAAEKLLSALYFKGCFAAPEREDRMKIHTEAKLFGEKMHTKYPKNKKITSLYAINLSLWAKEYGPLEAIREGAAKRVRDLADSAEDYQILGRAHQLLPYIPLLLNWPDKKLADKYLQMAIDTHPEDLNNFLFLAELRMDQERYQEALNLIDKALLLGIRKDNILEDRRTRWKLKSLREQVTEKMKTASQTFPF